MQLRALSPLLLALSLAGRARADELPAPPAPDRVQTLRGESLRSVSARQTALPPSGDVHFTLHGELQLRADSVSELRLRRGDGTFDELGQEERAYYWLRVTPRLELGRQLEIIGQADAPYGMLAGDEARGVRVHDERYAEREALRFDPRWLFAEYRTEWWSLRVGQQPFHHGLGLVENDGNHTMLFGDPQGGDRFERIQLLSRIPRSRVVILAAADLVYSDDAAELADGDLALRGTLGVRYGDRRGHVSALGIVRHQKHDSERARERELNSVIVDSAGGFEHEAPGAVALLFAEYEVAFRFGDESLERTLAGAVDDDELSVSGFGAAARLGAAFPSEKSSNAFGRWVLALEWGYASGDDRPQNLREQGFALDPNHRVGLVLFDHVLRWKSARAKSVVGASPRSFDVATRGGVAGATYMNPTLVFRPTPALDLKLGMVVGQATEDFVDPASVLVTGSPTNYDGGSVTARDLGLELDVGVEWRRTLTRGVALELGAQGGVLFPGNAFDSASGDALDLQHVTMARAGVQY